MKESIVTAGFRTTDMWSLNKKSMTNPVLTSIFWNVSEMGEVVKTTIRLGIMYQYHSRALYSKFQKSKWITGITFLKKMYGPFL